jgi:hypothetical protein
MADPESKYDTPAATPEPSSDAKKNDLKAMILQKYADDLQEQIKGAMDRVEDLCKKYTDTMNQLSSIGGLGDDQKLNQEDIINSLMQSSPSFDDCQTSEDLLSMVTQGMPGEMPGEMPGDDQGIPFDDPQPAGTPGEPAEIGLGDNTAIWNRMAGATAVAEGKKN